MSKSRFYKILDILEPADIILMSLKKYNFISSGIKVFDGGDFNHCVMYSGFEKVIHNTIGGKQETNLNLIIDSKHLYCIRRIPNLTDSTKEQILTESYKNIHYNYDYRSYLGLSIFNFLKRIGINLRKLGNPYSDLSHTVCSNDISICVNSAINYKLSDNIALNQITPQDLYKTDKLITLLDETK